MRLSAPLRSLLFFLILAPVACSFSDSSKSLSNSVGSSSRSISSSSPGASERAYQEDVADYTEAHVRGGGDVRGFQADLGKIAERHGITNWEENQSTYIAIGKGLAKAKLNETQFMAYQRSLGASDPVKMEAIQKGYDSER